MASSSATMLSNQKQVNTIPRFLDDDRCSLDGHSCLEILLGKEKNVFNHCGNKRFRAIIHHNVQKYIDLAKKPEKTKFVRAIYVDMKRAGYRFLKRDQFGLWCELRDVDSREKLSHALRDRVRDIERSDKKTKKEKLFKVFSESKRINKALTRQKEPSILSLNHLISCTKPVNVSSKLDGWSTENILITRSVFADNGKGASRERTGSLRLVEDDDEISLFGGMANEIADAMPDTSSVAKRLSRDKRQGDNDPPLPCISFSMKFSQENRWRISDDGFMRPILFQY